MYDNEQIIEKVREHPILFDQTNSDYKNVKKKDKIWDGIASSIAETKGGIYIGCIRFQIALHTSEMIALTVLNPILKLWPIVTKSRRNGKIFEILSVSTSEVKKQRLDRQLSCWTALCIQFARTESNVLLTLNDPCTSQSEHEENVSQTEPHNLQTPKKRKVIKSPPQSAAVKEVISYLEDRKQSTISDDIDIIFQGYARTVKKFSARRQIFVKYKISQLLMEQELARLEENDQQLPVAEHSTQSHDSFTSLYGNRPQSQTSNQSIQSNIPVSLSSTSEPPSPATWYEL
nr:unnamed protein product [Callosobruchus chinensis]